MPGINLVVNFTDGLVEEGVPGGSGIKTYQEKDGFEFFVGVTARYLCVRL
jgi:hypothetical protein